MTSGVVRSRSLTGTLRLVLAALCAVSVANIYYAQPLLGRIGGDLGIPVGQLGWIVAVGQVGYLVGLILLVPLGDMVNRRVLITVHIVLAALGTVVIATSANGVGLLVGVGIAGVFSVVVQVIVAYTAAISAPDQRGRNIGVVTSGVVVGIILARTFSGLIADLADWRAVYVTSTVVSLLLAMAALAMLPGEPRRRGRVSYTSAVTSVFVLTFTDRVFRTRAVMTFFLFASFGVLWSGIALPLSDAPWRLTTTQIGLFGLAGLAGALGASRAGRWADRGWSGPVTALSLVLLIVSWWFTGQVGRSLWMLAVGVVLLDFAVQAVHVTSQNLIVARAPESSSRLIGSYMVYYSLGSALGAVTTAWLYQSLGWGAASILGAGYAAACLIVWALDPALPPSRFRTGKGGGRDVSGTGGTKITYSGTKKGR